jgi:putative flippase GtrA
MLFLEKENQKNNRNTSMMSLVIPTTYNGTQNILKIINAITFNFFLNKAWTFFTEYTLKQYGMFVCISSVGATLQLALLYMFVESGLQYGLSIILVVGLASASNLIPNKVGLFRRISGLKIDFRS